MFIDLYQVDAFTSAVFGGNPAAVCPLPEWLPETLMQQVAMENNLSETAFFVPEEGRFGLRWFTPEVEVDLCGHATLAAAHVLFRELNLSTDLIRFDTLSGELTVQKNDQTLSMDFPANPAFPAELPDELRRGLGLEDAECYKSKDYHLVLETRREVEDLDPDFHQLKKVDTRGIIVSAKGDEVDFVSRFFAPSVGIDEDPVTGSAHTTLTPYWSERLGKNELTARQISKRGGELTCRLSGDRVIIGGEAQTYLRGEIQIPD